MRGGHTEEHELGTLDRGGGADDEPEAAGGLTLVHQLLEMILHDRHLALLEMATLDSSAVATGHPVAQMSEGGRRGKSHITDTHDGHGVTSPVGQDSHGGATVAERGSR